MNKEIKIIKTNINDFSHIMDVEKLAFGRDDEANLAAELLSDSSAEPMLSLLAFHNNEAVGHILFTKVYFDNEEKQPLMHILAPLAIKPEFQKQGIGGMLINAGLEILKEMGSKLVFVLGHKEYYPKHGFKQNAQGMGFYTPYPDPMPDYYEEYWMVQSLSEDGFNIGNGKLRCANTLDKIEHWVEDTKQ